MTQQQKQPQQANAVNMIENRPVTPSKGWLHSFVSQTNWEGPIWQETWWGHHAPCRRLFLWLAFPIIALPVFAPWLREQENFPHFLNPDVTYDEFETLTLRCVEATRDWAHDLPLACRINNKEGTSRFIWDDDDNNNNNTHKANDMIPLPEECQFASRIMFNPTPKNQQSSSSSNPLQTRKEDEITQEIRGAAPVDWNHYSVPDSNNQQQREEQDDNYTLLHSFRLVEDKCAVEILDSKGETLGWTFHLFQSDRTSPTKEIDQIPNVFGRTFDNLHEKAGHVLSKVDVEKIFEHREGIAIVLGGTIIGIIMLFEMVAVAIQLLALTYVIRLVLPRMSKDYLVGMNQVSFGSTWQAFLLLTALTSTTNDLYEDKAFIIMAIPAVVALYYREDKAALEWAFLGVLSYGFASMSHALDSLAAAVQAVDALGIVRTAAFCLGVLIPGEGWHKLVRLYFYCVAYPPLRQRSASWRQQQQTQQQQQPSAPSGYSPSVNSDTKDSAELPIEPSVDAPEHNNAADHSAANDDYEPAVVVQ